MRRKIDGPASSDIAVIAVQFGQMPQTFSLWKKSVCWNADIDFILYTDQTIEDVPRNLRVIPLNIADLKGSISKVLGVSVCLERPYKICDYRPMFGVIFAADLEKYAYWGHCDLDLVFGNISKFLPEDIYSYDKLFVRGNFSLYRNSEKMNNLFRSSRGGLDWNKIVSTEANMHFDEWPGIYKNIIAHHVSLYNPDVIADIKVKQHHIGINYTTPGTIELLFWQEGEIFRHHWTGSVPGKWEARLLIHLQKRPMKEPDDLVLSAERIYFVSGKFIGGGLGDVLSLERALSLNRPSRLADWALLARRAAKKLKSRAGI